ncbi:MAG: GntR family transcriptional regulator [Rhizobiales bacterium]|nr:GntR family transcriptional regulator [Hyphomicrobiales bacterium]
MATLRGDERLPRYQRVADQLRQEIADGVRRPGDRMPSENLLADQYALAPGTIRQAVTQLVSEGVLERFQGKGTFVRRPSFDQSLFRFFRFLGRPGERVVPEGRILGREAKPAPEYVSLRLELDQNAPAICLSRLRLLRKQPVLLEEIWLSKEDFMPILEIDEKKLGPLLYPIYDELCGRTVANAEEELTVEAADHQTAQTLQIAEGDPVIVIERLAKGFDGSPLEWRRSVGRADQFRYQIEIR